MDQNKKLIFLFVYFMFFIFSFLLFFKTALFLRGRDTGVFINANILGKDIVMESTQDSLEMKVIFAISCLLVALSSILLVVTVISYNFDVIKDPESETKKEILKIWQEKEDEKH